LLPVLADHRDLERALLAPLRGNPIHGLARHRDDSGAKAQMRCDPRMRRQGCQIALDQLAPLGIAIEVVDAPARRLEQARAASSMLKRHGEKIVTCPHSATAALAGARLDHDEGQVARREVCGRRQPDWRDDGDGRDLRLSS
jgi:hypothetical protein